MKYIVRASVDLSCEVEASTPDEAIQKAPVFTGLEQGDWDTIDYSDYEAEES